MDTHLVEALGLNSFQLFSYCCPPDRPEIMNLIMCRSLNEFCRTVAEGLRGAVKKAFLRGLCQKVLIAFRGEIKDGNLSLRFSPKNLKIFLFLENSRAT